VATLIGAPSDRPHSFRAPSDRIHAPRTLPRKARGGCGAAKAPKPTFPRSNISGLRFVSRSDKSGFVNEGPLAVMSKLLIPDNGAATPSRLVGRDAWRELAPTLPDDVKAIVERTGFSGAVADLALAPASSGRLDCVYFGMGDAPAASAMPLRGLVAKLPSGDYRIVDRPQANSIMRGARPGSAARPTA
jgi:hypothetical protein